MEELPPSYVFKFSGEYHRYSSFGGLEPVMQCCCGRWVATKTLQYSNSRDKHYQSKVHIREMAMRFEPSEIKHQESLTTTSARSSLVLPQHPIVLKSESIQL